MTENAPGGGERRIEEQRKKQSPVGSWIVTRPIPDVAARVRLTRAGVPPTADSVEGTEPNPAEAIRILQTFALHRAIEDLLELAPTPARPPANGTAAESAFDPLDAQTVLALAALIRPVDQAAQLAIGRWAKEGGERAVRTPLTDSIVHDVTAQRTVPEVAKFIHAFRWAGQDGLVRKALEAFSGPRSGRTILDKALLYIALADSRLAEEPSAGWQTQSPDADEAARQAQALNRDAHILLGRVLHAEYGTARAAPGREGAVPETVLGVLRHLSPSKHIVQQWVDEEMRVGGTEKETTELMAVVLLNEGPAENALAEHIGRTWTALNVRNLCALLAGSKARAAGPLLESIRRSAARQDGPNAAANVAELVRLWSRNSRLAPTREDLILEVVTGGTGDLRRPRPFAFLRDIDAALENEGESSRHRDSILEKALLAFVADADEALTVKRADETEQSGQDRETALLRLCGWQGKDIAYLVSRISDRAKLWYTADLVNRTLVDCLFRGADPDGVRLATYIRELQDFGPRAARLTFWALRELSNLSAPKRVPAPMDTGTLIAKVAVLLFEMKAEDVAFDLLERCLENEQLMTPEHAAAVIVEVKREPELSEDVGWMTRLSATLGRWAEVHERDTVVRILRDRADATHFERECEAIILTVT